MANIKIKLAYDGTAYLGWQKTKMGPSIEQTLQEKIEQILQHPVRLQAASRTDAGVHAVGQIINFKTTKESLDLKKLALSLNSLLPKDLCVLEAECVHEDFHATLDCRGKEYHYTVCYGHTQLPMHRLYSWHFPHALNLEEMKKAAKDLVGEHDFAAFCNAKKSETYKDTIRHVKAIEIEEIADQRLLFKISGNHFLYKMVRNLVGTLIHIGCGKLKSQEITSILASGDRRQAGVTAPASGLALRHVFY
jgi:tRNA pseudouridine38-40 synthase